jgi:type I restriction enzyme R subunit
MSKLLDALIQQRRQEAIAYEEYLQKIVELTKKVKSPATGAAYPASLATPGKRALYDNLGKDEALALAVDATKRQDDWRNNPFKLKAVRNAIKAALGGAVTSSVVREGPPAGEQTPESDDERVDRILELVKQQDEY